MKQSEQTDQLSRALAAAQGEMSNPPKNATAKIPLKSGGSYSYSYADLPTIIETIRKPLAKNEICHTTLINPDGPTGTGSIIVRLSHSSGQFMESELVLPASHDPKALAANLTYFRRYLLTALVGVAADEDTDGVPETGGEYKTREQKPKPAQPPVAKKVSDKKPAQISSGDFVPQVGRFIGKPLRSLSDHELTEYDSVLRQGLAESGKTIEQLSTLQRELMEAVSDHLKARIEAGTGGK